MLYFGQICDIDAKSGRVKVNIPHLDIVTEFIPFLRMFAQDNSVSIPAAVNEVVLVGQTPEGYWAVLGAACNDSDKPYSGANNDKFGIKFANGTLLEHNIKSNETKIDTSGKVVVKADTVEITSTKVTITAPVIELKGAVNVSGMLSAGAGMSITGDATGSGTLSAKDVKAGAISLSTHVHPGVSPGSGVTGPAK